MKRKIAIGATAGLVACGMIVGLLLGGESKKEEFEATTTQVEQTTVIETTFFQETETETEIETEKNAPPFGLTNKEYEYIDNYLRNGHLEPLNASFDDLTNVGRIPNENIPTMSGKVDYSKKYYMLHFKDGKEIQIFIPMDELEE